MLDPVPQVEIEFNPCLAELCAQAAGGILSPGFALRSCDRIMWFHLSRLVGRADSSLGLAQLWLRHNQMQQRKDVRTEPWKKKRGSINLFSFLEPVGMFPLGCFQEIWWNWL